MSSGKIIAMVLEAEGAILKWRDTMGATDPAKAAPGTIRRDLGTSIQNNVHARFGRAGNRRLRNRLLLCRPRTYLVFYVFELYRGGTSVRPFFCVPSMFVSSEVQVLFTT